MIRTEVISFADMFFDKIADVTYTVADLAGTPQARVDTALWRIHYCTNAIQIATGPNPKANLIDMMTLVSLGRMAMEALPLSVCLAPTPESSKIPFAVWSSRGGRLRAAILPRNS
ncbi:MAG: hypothetical protein BROFUL_02068 [Candidatus Brocadia fulgida]|uniref:Uncharacterized protein n=1 Tax=Candidatus Brocadia fulgida TaxID=380242 RepID=A0A0M2UXM5_9BACT|nr:MAG: hypothetical protein BROFUL_02068 [Candidatus Brocadia fulgida]